MKKLTLLTLLLGVFATSYAQNDVSSDKNNPAKTGIKNNQEYKALNGITYKIGDTVRLGRGSDPQGTFRYLEMGGWGAALGYDITKGPEQNNIGRKYAGLAVVIKKIKQVKVKGVSKTVFTVGGGNITNYNLSIDDAIATCEVTPCNDSKNVNVVNATKESALDKLKKLKELLDVGAITQKEYDAKKAKIMEEI